MKNFKDKVVKLEGLYTQLSDLYPSVVAGFEYTKNHLNKLELKKKILLHMKNLCMKIIKEDHQTQKAQTNLAVVTIKMI